MIGFTDTSITITVNYNSSQSMTETCSSFYWTTSVFSSAVTDLVLIYEPATSASVVRRLILHSWALNSLLYLRGEPNISHHVLQFLHYSVFLRLFVATGTCLPNHCPVMDYSASIRCSGNVCLASRWLAMDFRSGSTIPSFRRHVTKFSLVHRTSR
jgi:hypothetical protein